MTYLLDTDVVIDHLRKRQRLHDEVIATGCGISMLSWGELAYGAQKSSFPETSMAVVDDFLRENGVALVELSREIMRAYAHERARLEKKGEGLDQFDLLIAATALAHSLILVTRNTKHFSRIEGLRLAGE